VFVWPMLVLVVAGSCCWIRYSYLCFPFVLLFVCALAWNMAADTTRPQSPTTVAE
jgi:hypothetical protein